MKFAAANGITGELLVKGGTRAHLTLAPPPHLYRALAAGARIGGAGTGTGEILKLYARHTGQQRLTIFN